MFSAEIKVGKHCDANKLPGLQGQLMDCKLAIYELVAYLSHPKHPSDHQSPGPYLDGINSLETHAQATFWNLIVNRNKIR